MVVKMRIGAINRSRYLMENHIPKTIIGNDAHQTIISGSVINWRSDASCQGKGAKNRYNSPRGIFEIAPPALETSTSSPHPDLADLAASLLVCSIRPKFPNDSRCTLAYRVIPR